MLWIRWYILTVFSLLTFTQSAWWVTFSTVTPLVEVPLLLFHTSPSTNVIFILQKVFGLHAPEVNLLLSWGMIIYVPLAPIAMYGLARPQGGLRVSVLLTALVVFLGAFIRYFLY